MRAKILSEEVLSNRFSKLSEYELQFPSLAHDGEHAAPITREVLHTSDAIVLLLYAPDIDSFVFVEEYRTGVLFNKAGEDPLMLECVAGMIDKDRTPEDIARAEAWEEAGVRVEALRKIACVYNSAGRMTERTHVFYAECAGAVHGGVHGLAAEGEQMRVRVIPRRDVYAMMDRMEFRTAIPLLALNWFRARDENSMTA